MKYDWNNDHKHIMNIDFQFIKCEYYKEIHDDYFDYNNEKSFFS